jgi:hypothetical protein
MNAAHGRTTTPRRPRHSFFDARGLAREEQMAIAGSAGGPKMAPSWGLFVLGRWFARRELAESAEHRMKTRRASGHKSAEKVLESAPPLGKVWNRVTDTFSIFHAKTPWAGLQF